MQLKMDIKYVKNKFPLVYFLQIQFKFSYFSRTIYYYLTESAYWTHECYWKLLGLISPTSTGSGDLDRIMPLIAPNWTVWQRHDAAKCCITAENSLHCEKWPHSRISLISSKVSTLKYKLLHESYLNAFASYISLFICL